MRYIRVILLNFTVTRDRNCWPQSDNGDMRTSFIANGVCQHTSSGKLVFSAHKVIKYAHVERILLKAAADDHQMWDNMRNEMNISRSSIKRYMIVTELMEWKAAYLLSSWTQNLTEWEKWHLHMLFLISSDVHQMWWTLMNDPSISKLFIYMLNM